MGQRRKQTVFFTELSLGLGLKAALPPPAWGREAKNGKLTSAGEKGGVE